MSKAFFTTVPDCLDGLLEDEASMEGAIPSAEATLKRIER